MTHWMRSNLAAAGLMAVLGSAQAQTPPADLLAAAQKEGEVVWYETSVPGVADKIRAAFDAKFPGVKLRHVSVPNAEQMGPRLLQEARTGVPSADLVQISADQIANMHKRQILADVDWGKVGVDKKMVPAAYAVATSATVVVLMANTKQVPEAERPKTWNALLDPRWKGKMSAWANPYSFALLASAWGDADARAYLEKFARQDPSLFPAPAASVQAVVSGDLPLGVGLSHIAQHSVDAGAPLALSTLDVVPVAVNYSSVLAKARHPNAARLLVWWLTSADGARAYEQATKRGNIYVDATEAAKSLKGKQVSAWPFEKGDAIATLLPPYQALLRNR
ncbi:MAG: extracellular solute-binding protein [Proteobacteria bacterium]|jgi:iron(III) transport system substrate-binding protein|nr:extracellular solute-binding protein [Pseudomonadota bacterium]